MYLIESRMCPFKQSSFPSNCVLQSFMTLGQVVQVCSLMILVLVGTTKLKITEKNNLFHYFHVTVH